VKPPRKIKLTPAAKKQFHNAIRWYGLRSRDVATDFVLAVDARITSIIEAPERYPLVADRLRRALVGSFPYVLYFEIGKGGGISVVACLHERQDREKWGGG
jgi:plasmid stabilization system protein ParE